MAGTRHLVHAGMVLLAAAGVLAEEELETRAYHVDRAAFEEIAAGWVEGWHGEEWHVVKDCLRSFFVASLVASFVENPQKSQRESRQSSR